MAKNNDLDEFGFEPLVDNELEEFGFESEAVEEPKMGAGEASLRGAGQGLTFDFLDEMIAAGKAIPEDILAGITGEGAGPAIKRDERGVVTNTEELRQNLPYDKYVKEERAKFAKARKDQPAAYIASDIAAGVIPALVTGGATAVGNIGKSLGKEVIKEGAEQVAKKTIGQAMKEGAKTGAKYGATTGAGMSEAETLEDLIADTARGGVMGAGAGVVLPTVLKGAGAGYNKLKDTAGNLMEMLPSIKTGYVFGQKHGLAGGDKIKNLMDKTSRELVKETQKAMKKAGDITKDISERFDVTEDIAEAVATLREKAKGGLPKDSLKITKLANELEEGLLKRDIQLEKLVAKTEKEIAKKVQKSGNKELSAVQKAESRAVQEAEQTGSSLEQLENINKRFEDVAELPYDTKGGKLTGQSAKFKETFIDPETGKPFSEYYNKKYIQDTTKFDPSDIKSGRRDDGSIFAEYADKATGEKFKQEGTGSLFSGTDYSNASMKEILDLTSDLGTKAFDKGDGGIEAEGFKTVWKALRNKLPELNLTLPKSKQEMYKLFQTMELLGIKSGKLKNPSPVDITELMNKLPRKMENERHMIQKYLLGSGSDLSKKIDDVDLISNAKRYLDKGSDSGVGGEFTKAGVLQRGSALISNVAGATHGKISKVANKVNSIPVEKMGKVAEGLAKSENKGLQAMGRQLEAALQSEDAVKNAMIWSLSQNPAFRKAAEKTLPQMDKDMSETLGVDVESPLNDILFDTEEEAPIEEGTRDPASVEDIDQDFMHSVEGYKEQGYIPKSRSGKVLGKSGVTIANALDLGQRDNLDDLDMDGDIKEILKPYLGLKKEEADKFLKENPLDLSGDVNNNGIVDAQEVKEATHNEYYDKVQANFDGNNKHGAKFEDLPKEVQTILYSKQFQTGKLGMSTINAASNDDDYSDLIDTFKDSKNKRRQKEGSYLEEKLEDVKKSIDRQARQMGAGDTIPESHVDQTLGAIDNLDITEDQKDALQDEAIKMETYQDAEKLKRLLDTFKAI